MDEEEYRAKLLEGQFVEEPIPPDPLPGIIQDVFFNVDNETGTVGIGTAAAIGARVHIISNDPFNAVRIIQKGTGDVLLIDNKDLANPNDPPQIPYFNIKNDGKIGIGTTLPLSEIHLITDKEASNILIGDLPGSRSSTDSGMTFSGLANTVTSGLFTEVDGLLVSLAANVSQVGVVDTSRVGGIVRIDTRRRDELTVDPNIPGDYSSFTVKGVPIGIGSTSEYNVLTANLDTGDINIAPEKGEVYVGAYSSVTSVGIGTTAIDDQYRLYVNGNTGIAGTLSLPDYSKITVGVSSDLSIYHDPDTNTSYILENNPTGNLVIAGNDIEFKNTGLAKTYAYFRNDGAVDLYYDNVKKLETTPDGVFIGSLGFSTTGIISGPQEIIIDPSVVGNDTGIVRIKGDLYIEGGTTQLYSTVVNIADKNIGIATIITGDLPNANFLLSDAGLLIGIGTIQKRFTYNFLNDSLRSTENIDLDSGKVYKIEGNNVLSSTTLGIGVTTSSLNQVGTLNYLNVQNLTATEDLNVTGFATITNIVGTALSFTDLNVGIATIGVASITNARVGIETVGYSSITNLNVVGVATILNLTVGTPDGFPFGSVGILTVGAISPLGGLVSPNIGSERQVLIATGSSIFNQTGIGLSWTEFSLAALGATTGAGITAVTTGDYYITGVSVDSFDPITNTGVAATAYEIGLKYNRNTLVLSDTIGNFRSIPPTTSAATAGIGSTVVGQTKIVAVNQQILNGEFYPGDALTIVNLGSSPISISVTLGGTLRLAGTTITGPRNLFSGGIATILCVFRDPISADNIFLISGAGV
jgi:hypothetical protein